MTQETGSSTNRATALHETLIALFELGEVDPETLRSALERVAPEDAAEVIGGFEPDQKVLLFRSLPSAEDRAIVLEETDRQSHREIVESLAEDERQAVFGEMPVDDLVDHLEELPREEQRSIIASLEKEDAENVAELLRYEPDTAGGMMTTEVITIRRGTTSRDALAEIQGNLGAEVIAYVYVVDRRGALVGVVSIRGILQASPETVVDGYMETDVVKVHVDTDREEVAAIFDKYNLAVVPVVDDEDGLRGIVTFDDVIDAMQEEHSEDMLRMAGTTTVDPLHEPVLADVFKRVPFLMVTMAGGLVVAMILDFLGSRALPLVFPAMVIWVHLVSALSGNVAVVTSTVLVRGFALSSADLGLARVRRALGREIVVAGVIALLLALLAAGEIWVYGHLTGVEAYLSPRVIIALFTAMTVSVAWAGLIGALVPTLCHLSRRIDPAIASGPFVTITCDISASLIFLLIIMALIGGDWPPA